MFIPIKSYNKVLQFCFKYFLNNISLYPALKKKENVMLLEYVHIDTFSSNLSILIITYYAVLLQFIFHF